MKRLGLILLLLAAAAPVWSAKKMTVEQLKETLVSLQHAQKSDADMATELMKVELTEQLTAAARSGLAQYISGPEASEQLDILVGRSAFLAPPAADLPTAPGPDAAAQKAILVKAADYVAKIYTQNPHLTASKLTSRFQDDVVNTSSTPGLTINTSNTYQRLWDTRTDPVDSDRGIEKPAASKAKTKWGENGQISEGEPGPNLGAVMQEAAAGGKLDWLRWQTIDGKQTAVFSFTVDKKKTHYDVSYCCFPSTDTQSGIAAEGTFTPLPGEIQSVTSWRPFKKVVGYHGELYIDPDKGTVVRSITIADLKPTDFVHQEAIRIDYGPVVIDGKEYEAPVRSFTQSEVVPHGDSATSVYSVRHMLFIVKYTNYHLAG